MNDEIRELTPDEQVELENMTVSIDIIEKYLKEFMGMALQNKVLSISLAMVLTADQYKNHQVGFISYGHSDAIIKSTLRSVDVTLNDFPHSRASFISELKTIIEKYEQSDAAQTAN